MRRLLLAFVTVTLVAVSCSNDDDDSKAEATTTTVQDGVSTCDFKVGELIVAEDLERYDAQGACVRTFDCADGRVHVEARVGANDFAPIDPNGAGKGLEGFAPVDQGGDPRPDTSDAVWQERGAEHDDTGRTKLQVDCGG